MAKASHQTDGCFQPQRDDLINQNSIFDYLFFTQHTFIFIICEIKLSFLEAISECIYLFLFVCTLRFIVGIFGIGCGRQFSPLSRRFIFCGVFILFVQLKCEKCHQLCALHECPVKRFHLRIPLRSNIPRRRHSQCIWQVLVGRECRPGHCLRPMWMSPGHLETRDSAAPDAFRQLSIRQSGFWLEHAMTWSRPIVGKWTNFISVAGMVMAGLGLTSTTLYSPSLAVCPSKICLMCKRSGAFSNSSDLASHVTAASFLSSDTPSFRRREFACRKKRKRN